MDEVDQDEDGVPEEGVEGAQDDPAPQREEHAPDGERDAQVEDAVDAVGRQVRQEQEDVGELEVDVVDGQPVAADAELAVVHAAQTDDVPDVVGRGRVRGEEGRGGGGRGQGGGRSSRGTRGRRGASRACRGAAGSRQVEADGARDGRRRRVVVGEVVEQSRDGGHDRPHDGLVVAHGGGGGGGGDFPLTRQGSYQGLDSLQKKRTIYSLSL